MQRLASETTGKDLCYSGTYREVCEGGRLVPVDRTRVIELGFVIVAVCGKKFGDIVEAVPAFDVYGEVGPVRRASRYALS